MPEPPINRVKEDLHPALRRRLEKLEQLLVLHGLKAELFEGFRTRERQSYLYNKLGAGKATLPGHSLHEYGLAADYAFRDSQGKWTWTGNWTTFGSCAIAAGLTWGGDWANVDSVHVQYTGGLKLTEIMSGARPPVDQPQSSGGGVIKIVVNDVLVTEGSVKDGSVVAPVRAICEALGATVVDHIADQGKVYVYKP